MSMSLLSLPTFKEKVIKNKLCISEKFSISCFKRDFQFQFLENSLILTTLSWNNLARHCFGVKRGKNHFFLIPMEAIYIALRADAAKNQKSGIRGVFKSSWNFDTRLHTSGGSPTENFSSPPSAVRKLCSIFEKCILQTSNLLTRT